MFILIERRTEKPLLNLDLFKVSSFLVANVGVFMALFSVIGVLFVISVYLGSTQGRSALGIALCVIFVPGTSALVSPIVGRISRWIRPRYLLVAGLLFGAMATLVLSAVDATTGYLDLVWRLGFLGVANAIMMTSAPIAAINAVSPAFGGMAGATNTAARQIGAALGPAVIGTVYAVNSSATAGLQTALWVAAALLSFSSMTCLILLLIGRKLTRTH